MDVATDEPAVTPSILMHDTVNHLSSILSIAQFCLLSKDMSPEVQTDMKRIVESARHVADNLKYLAALLEAEEE